MEGQTLLNIGFALSGSLGTFVLYSTWDALKSMRSDLAALQKSITDNYMRKDDFRDHANRVEALLIEIRNDLKHKVDKE